MSYTLIVILVIGIPLLIYFLVSIKRKKQNVKEHEKQEGKNYQEGEAKDKDLG